MRTNPIIPRDITASNRIIADAVLTLLLDYKHVLGNGNLAFLRRLRDAPPDYIVTDKEGRLLNRLLRRAAYGNFWPGRY